MPPWKGSTEWNVTFPALLIMGKVTFTKKEDKRTPFCGLAGQTGRSRLQIDSRRTNLHSVYPVLLGLDLWFSEILATEPFITGGGTGPINWNGAALADSGVDVPEPSPFSHGYVPPPSSRSP